MSSSASAIQLIDQLLTLIEAKQPRRLTGNLNPLSTMAKNKISEFVYKSWDESVLSTLEKYISIPNQSPDYDAEIYNNGYQEDALKLLVNWVEAHPVKGLKMDVMEEKDKTPFIFMEVDATDSKCEETVLMYGHFDKQPPLDPKDWAEDLGPYKPVIKDGKLYGRGGADDGYSIFAAIDSLRALQSNNLPHPRCVITIEASEESGSPHLDYYLEKVKDRIGKPSVVICLDSGCGNYDQLWCTSSLRGIAIGMLRAQLLKEGIHSGSSGAVRDSFHVLRHVLDKFDDALTGECKIPELSVEIPASHHTYAEECAKALGDEVWTTLPMADGCDTQLPAKLENAKELLLNQWWRPQLTITGVDGLPALNGGNVLRKFTTLKLSIRLPPSIKDPAGAFGAVKKALESDPPFGAKVELTTKGHFGVGFACPEYEPWLMEALQSASQTYYKKPCLMMGEGGSIPLMGELLEKFPQAQFVVTGILGPNSNAHGPNEFLHIDFTKKLICCVADILHSCATHK